MEAFKENELTKTLESITKYLLMSWLPLILLATFIFNSYVALITFFAVFVVVGLLGSLSSMTSSIHVYTTELLRYFKIRTITTYSSNDMKALLDKFEMLATKEDTYHLAYVNKVSALHRELQSALHYMQKAESHSTKTTEEITVNKKQ